jgi:hypothetical protein
MLQAHQLHDRHTNIHLLPFPPLLHRSQLQSLAHPLPRPHAASANTIDIETTKRPQQLEITSNNHNAHISPMSSGNKTTISGEMEGIIAVREPGRSILLPFTQTIRILVDVGKRAGKVYGELLMGFDQRKDAENRFRFHWQARQLDLR